MGHSDLKDGPFTLDFKMEITNKARPFFDFRFHKIVFIKHVYLFFGVLYTTIQRIVNMKAKLKPQVPLESQLHDNKYVLFNFWHWLYLSDLIKSRVYNIDSYGIVIL